MSNLAPIKRNCGRRGEGFGIAWLRQHVNTTSDECLIWPLAKNPYSGYGTVGYNGKIYYAHNLMCRLAHGEPPSSKHEAAHSCGGKACTNPRHLSWKTRRENHLDRRRQGTATTNSAGNRGKLTVEQCEEILRLSKHKGVWEISKQFKVSILTVRRVQAGATRVAKAAIERGAHTTGHRAND